VQSKQVSPRRADRAIAHLVRMPLQHVELPAVASRALQLRENLTPYDVESVAVAELLSAPLVTADTRLAGATGPRCFIELIRTATTAEPTVRASHSHGLRKGARVSSKPLP
jgi:predicted nucleic acid-binding protein